MYARSLRFGEEDSGEVVHVPAGKRLAIRAGDLSISSEELDAKSAKGRGGVRSGGGYHLDLVSDSGR